MGRTFRKSFVALFDAHYHRLHRYLNRLSGDPDLAADIVQEAYIKLYERGALPDAPVSWLITVATNLYRNVYTTRARRNRLLEVVPEAKTYADRPVLPVYEVDSADVARRVRAALDRMPEREKQMLLLRAEGYDYREIAGALDLRVTSVGTLLSRAKRLFRELYEAKFNASQ